MEIIFACNKKALPHKAQFHLRLTHSISISTLKPSIHYLQLLYTLEEMLNAKLEMDGYYKSRKQAKNLWSQLRILWFLQNSLEMNDLDQISSCHDFHKHVHSPWVPETWNIYPSLLFVTLL